MSVIKVSENWQRPPPFGRSKIVSGQVCKQRASQSTQFAATFVCRRRLDQIIIIINGRKCHADWRVEPNQTNAWNIRGSPRRWRCRKCLYYCIRLMSTEQPTTLRFLFFHHRHIHCCWLDQWWCISASCIIFINKYGMPVLRSRSTNTPVRQISVTDCWLMSVVLRNAGREAPQCIMINGFLIVWTRNMTWHGYQCDFSTSPFRNLICVSAETGPANWNNGV